MEKMKKLLAACVLILALAPAARAQITELSVGTMLLFQKMHGDTIVNYATMIEHAAESGLNAYNQLQTAIRMEKMALENLKSVSNIKSFDDAKKWTNRALDMERAAREAIKQTTVKIGNTAHSVTDIADRLDSPDWLEVSDSERAQVYQRLGLSPSNYAYLKTWQQIDRDMLEKSLGMAEAYKEKRKEDAKKRADMAEKYKNSGDTGITDNALLRDSNALAIESISVQEDIRDGIADMNKRAAVEDMQRQALPETARVSDTFSRSWYGDSPVTAETEDMDEPED